MKKKSKLPLYGISAILILCLGSFAATVGFVYLITLPVRLNPGLLEGMKIINSDPAVAEMFGSPIRQSVIVMGTLKTTLYGGGFGNLWTPISGPLNHGEANFHVTKPEGGQWQVDSISIRINRKLVLLWDAGQTGSGFRKYASPPAPASSSTPMPPPTQVPLPSATPAK